MADILIRGMEMPISCQQCKFAVPYCGEWVCAATPQLSQCHIDKLERLPECPLIALPEGHGRLVDADALMSEFERAEKTMEQHGQEYSCSFMSSGQEISTEWYCVEDMLDNAPTIVPAEKEEKT